MLTGSGAVCSELSGATIQRALKDAHSMYGAPLGEEVVLGLLNLPLGIYPLMVMCMTFGIVLLTVWLDFQSGMCQLSRTSSVPYPRWRA